MSFFSAVWNLVKKIFSKLFSWLKEIFGDWWWLLLIIAVIWFAPAIAGWLASVGAPEFLVSAMTWIGSTMTPYVVTAGGWLWSGGASLVSSAWTAYKGLDFGTQAMLAVGAAALLAPEETEAVLEEGVDLVTDVIGTVGSAIASSSAFMWALGAAAIYFLFLRDTKKEEPQPIVITQAPDAAVPAAQGR